MAEPWEPSVAEVKSVIPQRLGGRPFTALSIPSKNEVIDLISEIAGEILRRTGGTVPVEYYDDAKKATKYLTAARLEVMLYPEQQRGEQSPAAVHTRAGELYLDQLQQTVVGTEVELAEQTGKPRHSFPEPVPDYPTIIDYPLTGRGF